MKLKYKIKRFFSRFKYRKGDWVIYYSTLDKDKSSGRIIQRTFDLNNRKIYLVELGTWHEYVAEKDIIKKID